MFTSKLPTITIAFLISCMTLNMSWASPGYIKKSIDVPHRSELVPLHIWYPTQDRLPVKRIGQNPVFEGIEVQINASLPKSKLPAVLLSHGSGGNAANLGWLAGYLAENGMIVIAPNHPGTTSGDSDPHKTVKIWERSKDLSAIIDHLEGEALEPINVDLDRIAAIGFSLGGHTALSLAGARVEKSKYIEYCDKHEGQYDCGWLSSGGVDFNEIDQGLYNQSNFDSRVKSVISIDPALAAAYTEQSLKGISIPVSLINLGAPDEVPPGINISDFADNTSSADIKFIDNATHFSFLGECAENGKKILEKIGEDALCTEVGTRSRADIHDELKQLIFTFLREVFAD